MNSPQTRLGERWDAPWLALGLRPDPDLRDALLARYREPGRHYHTAQHLAECLAELDRVRHLARRPDELALALWFHDAVYDPRRNDNEERSAAWARRALTAAGAAPEVADRVSRLVLATTHTATPAEGDARLLADIDLAILGAPPERYAEYETQIRREYAWASEPAFRAGRSGFLRGLLSRESIYLTSHYRERLEARARENLRASLDRLER
jgi:predicted metal-dependent HD superfamily phosphohydrolase